MVKFADFTEPQRPHEVLMFLRQTLHITVDRSSERQVRGSCENKGCLSKDPSVE